MRRFLVPAIVLLACGCGKDHSRTIIGKWERQEPPTLAREQKAYGIEFDRDGALHWWSWEGVERMGTWKLVDHATIEVEWTQDTFERTMREHENNERIRREIGAASVPAPGKVCKVRFGRVGNKLKLAWEAGTREYMLVD